jgi:hypothetical protein
MIGGTMKMPPGGVATPFGMATSVSGGGIANNMGKFMA